jgi:hypothetical protein
MNQADIIRMAREAGIYHGFDSEGQWDGLTNTELFERHPHPSDKVYGEKRMVEMLAPFAALVEAAVREAIKWNSLHSCHADCQNPACVIVREAVAAEREACAKVCDERAAVHPMGSDEQCEAEDCAAAIRARAQG